MSMMIKTKKTQTNLVKMLLASSVLLSTVGVVGVAQAAAIDIGAGSTTTNNFPPQAAADFYNFNKANSIFTVIDGLTVTADGGGLSIDNDNGAGGVANTTLIFQGSSVVNGSIGASNNGMETILFNGVAGKTVSITDTVQGNNLTVNGGTVNFLDVVTTNNDFIGDNQSNTTFFANGNVIGRDGTFKNASVVNFNDDTTFQQNLILKNGSTARVLSGKTVAITTANLDIEAGSQLTFDLENTLTPGQFTAGGNANIDADRVVNVTNANLTLYTVGTPVTKNLVTAAAGIVADPILNAPNNLFIKFETVVTPNTQLDLKVTRLAPTGLDDNIQGLATTLGGVTNTTAAGQPELLALLDNLGDFSDVEAQKEALASIAPLVDGGLTSAVLNTQETTFDLFSQRLSELRAGLDTYRTGYAAGSMDERGYGTWVKIFGSHADQNKRDNVKGYEAETWGLALGADMQVSDNSLVGVAFSWASADVNHDLNSGGTDIDSYQGALYGSWNIKGPLYFNWMGSVAKNEYDSTRHTIVNNFRQTTVADFEGSQYGARGELGYVYGCKDFYITPMLSLSYAHLDFDDYREEGNSTANQFVNYKDVEALLAGAGVEFAYEYEWYKATMRPEVHANISYDFIGDKQESSSQFVNFGGAYDTVGASPSRTDYNVGLSLTTYGESGLGMSISYDYNWKSDYHVHAGFVRVRYEW